MPHRTLLRCLALLAICIGLLIATHGEMSGWAQESTPAKTDAELIAAWQIKLDGAEIAISNGADLTAAQLDDTKRSLDQVLSDAQALQGRGQARLGPLKAELASLGPAPEDTAPPEDPKVADTRNRLLQELSAIQGRMSQAQLATVRAQNLLADVGRLEQGRMTARMMTRGPTPLKLSVWTEAAGQATAIAEAALKSPAIWWDRIESRDLDETTAVVGLSLVLLSALLAWPLRSWILHRWGAIAQDLEPSYTRRILVAGATGLAKVLLPSIALAALVAAAHITEPIEDDFFIALVQGAAVSIIFFFVVAGLSNAALSPKFPNWRIVPATTLGAERLSTNITILAGIGSAAYFLYYAATKSGIPSNEFLSVLVFLRNLILAGFFLTLLRRRYWLEPGIQPMSGFWPAIRIVFAVIAIAAPLLSLAGYAALSRFTHSALVMTIALVGAALLLRAVLHEGLMLLLTPGRPATSGTRPSHMAFWARLIVDIALWPPVAYLLLLFYGISPALLNIWIGAALTGIHIGEVNLSLIDVAIAIFIAVFGLLLVGWAKRWLSDKVMPHTKFDIGLQNSLTAGFSYIGAIIVLMLAIVALGIDLSSLAIVAGALSVGIGFGLKTVAENFVAGLLLLIERPIKVGDWIVVGGNEGVVKRISVRSTEVETFDHATVIVPNSDLIGQSVVNWTHKNRMVRVIVSVGVAYGSDTRLVRDLLIKCAETHPHVVADPAPAVVFRSFADSALAFELRTFVDDADYVGEVRNDINFAINDAFREHKIEIPFPQRDLHIRRDAAASPASGTEADTPAEPSGPFASHDDRS